MSSVPGKTLPPPPPQKLKVDLNCTIYRYNDCNRSIWRPSLWILNSLTGVHQVALASDGQGCHCTELRYGSLFSFRGFFLSFFLHFGSACLVCTNTTALFVYLLHTLILSMKQDIQRGLLWISIPWLFFCCSPPSFLFLFLFFTWMFVFFSSWCSLFIVFIVCVCVCVCVCVVYLISCENTRYCVFLLCLRALYKKKGYGGDGTLPLQVFTWKKWQKSSII